MDSAGREKLFTQDIALCLTPIILCAEEDLYCTSTEVPEQPQHTKYVQYILPYGTSTFFCFSFFSYSILPFHHAYFFIPFFLAFTYVCLGLPINMQDVIDLHGSSDTLMEHLICNHFSRKVQKSGSRKVVLQTRI